MAFTFQINHNVRFRHDECLLQKAEENRPGLNLKRVTPERIVDLTQDNTKLEGIWIKESEKDIHELETYALKRDEALILDFGEHQVGHFRIAVNSVGSPMDAPLYLRLRFAEIPAELTGESADYDGWLSKSWIQEEFVHLDELPAELELPRRYSFRFVELKVIDTSPKWRAVFSKPVVVAESSADESLLPDIKLNDSSLQRICDVSIKTLADCMQDVFEDGPKRDRRLWLGDLRLQALANYVTFDNVKLVKRCLLLFAGMTAEDGRIPANIFVRPQNVPDDTFLFDYSLFFISCLYDYEQAHEDPELLQQLYPIAKKQMNLSLHYLSEQGELLSDENYPVFVDWSNEFNKDTAGQGIMIYVMKQFLVLAKKTEDEDVSLYEEILGDMCRYAREKLYDPSRNLFVSGMGQEYNIASQVWMVLAHVMSGEENKKIMETVVNELFPVKGIATPYMYHHVAEALFESGLTEDGIRLLKSYWGKMIQLGADTYWEAFDPDQTDYSPYGNPIVSSYCHAWGCTPVYLIKKYL